MYPGRLDHWLADPQVRTRHRHAAAVPARRLWAAAHEVRLADTRTLGRLVRWRIPGTRAEQTFRDVLAEYPFVVLEEGDGWSISGLCGRIWTLARDYPHLRGPEEFRAWNAPCSVRVVFAHWVEPDGEDASVLHSEARVRPLDRAAETRLRSLWMVIGVFERLIVAEPFAIAAARAEGR